MADNFCARFTTIAADDIGGAHYPRFKLTCGAPGASVDVCSANPLPVSIVSGGGSSSGGLTDTELRASAVPVSGSFYPATQPVSGTVSVSGAVAVTGTFWQATQPISGTVGISGTVSVSGTFFQATQPVSIAATVAVSGPLTDTQLRASAVPVSLASMPSTPVTGTFWQATQPVSGTVTITPPSLTKGTQGATGLSVQSLKDAGRTQFNAATVIGGVTCVTTEALLSMVPVRAGVAGSAGTSIAVTAGKTLRLTAIVFSTLSSSAAVLSGRCALRMNPSGAVTATSPILAIASTTQQAAALAEAGDTCVVPLPDGIEISGTQQVGLSQVCSAATGVVYASLIGFEY